MNIIKIVFFVYVTVCLAFFCNAQASDSSWFSVKAFLPAWNNVPVQLIVKGKVIYKNEVRQDVFSYNSMITEAKPAILEIKKGQGSNFLFLFLEPGVIKIRDEGRKLVVYGTPLNDAYAAVNKKFDSMTLLQKNVAFLQLGEYKKILVKEFVERNTASIISLKLLDDYFFMDRTTNDTVYYSLFQSLSSGLKKSYLGQKLDKEVTQRYVTAVGRKAPQLEMPDAENKKTALYQTGQFTLINFWASWCLSCRKENLSLVKIFNKYRNTNFTIVSVSLDNNRSAWLSCINKDSLVWKQVSDLKGWQGIAVKAYGVHLIPLNFLLDKQGIIIGKNLTPERLEAVIQHVVH